MFENSEFLAAALPASAAPLWPAIRPIYTIEKGRPSLVGSCTLVRVGPYHFAFTAAHITDFVGAGKSLGLLGERDMVIPAGHAVCNVPTEVRVRDTLDLAIVELSALESQRLGSVRFIDPTEFDVDVNLDFESDIQPAFMALGFPLTRQNRPREGLDVHPGGIVWAAEEMKPERYRQLGYDRGQNLLIPFNKKRSESPDGFAVPPDPTGLSGGGLFRFYGLPAERAGLVAIGIDWKREPEHFLAATRIGLFVEVLKSEFPHVGKFLDIY